MNDFITYPVGQVTNRSYLSHRILSKYQTSEQTWLVRFVEYITQLITVIEEIVSLVSLMLDTGLPCFRGQTIKQLKNRLQIDKSDSEAAAYLVNIIKRCYLSFRSKSYDMIQWVQNLSLLSICNLFFNCLIVWPRKQGNPVSNINETRETISSWYGLKYN
jgi:hypothetical protein